MKRGKWRPVVMYGADSSSHICECTACGDTVWAYTDREWKYCPNCGAYMGDGACPTEETTLISTENLIALRDDLYENDQISIQGLKKLNNLIASAEED